MAQKVLSFLLLLAFSIPVQLPPDSQAAGDRFLPLDKETVFCLYYKMSGAHMDDQDIEDLCFDLGRPNFSAYKPAEMFLKPGVMEFRNRLLGKMRDYGEGVLFTWSFKGILESGRSESYAFELSRYEKEMPHPTTYIRSALSREGWTLVEKAISRLSGIARAEVLEITIYLKPEGIDCRTERRKIAGEEVRLPLRNVIFRPIKIKIIPSGEEKRLGVSEW